MSALLRFGPFAIDEATSTLTRDHDVLPLSPKLVDILAHLVRRRGEIVTKAELLSRFWPDTFVAENTLTRAIADIRKCLDDHPDRPAFIQTLARRGYRFVAGVETSDNDSDPLRSWLEGRLVLETLDRSRLADAVAAFERTRTAMPDYAPAYAGLANAAVLQFEATRQRNVPDRDQLPAAIVAARRACAIDPAIGEAWAVLGHALWCADEIEESRAAAQRAVALEPGSWRHQFRLALVTWGEPRLRAADRALALMPACAGAHLLIAMVFLARGAVDAAARSARAGQALQQAAHPAMLAVGLHWISGLVASAAGDTGTAEAAFEREIAHGQGGLAYGRECALTARVALGFLHVQAGRRSDAIDAFRHAIAGEPRYARAVLGLVCCDAAPAEELDIALDELERGRKVTEAAQIRAVSFAVRGDAAGAIGALEPLVLAHPVSSAGWALSADPMFAPLRALTGFDAVVRAVAARAA